MTGTEWGRLFPNSILGLQTLTTDMIDKLQEEMDRLSDDVYGSDGTLGGTKAAMTYSASTLTLSAKVGGYTGEGERLEGDPADSAWTSIPYADSGATTYYIGAKKSERPSRLTGNTSDGGFVYDRWTEVVGEDGQPDSVTVVGGTSLRFVVNTLVAPGWTVANTRPVYVWLNTPEDALQGFQAGTAAYDAGSGDIRIDIPNLMGQSAASTTAADYTVVILGPTVTTTDIRTDDDYWIIGSVASGTFSDADQTLFVTWGNILSLFTTEHDGATGEHLKITVNNDVIEFAGAATAQQIQVNNGLNDTDLELTNTQSGQYCQLYYDGVLEQLASKTANDWQIATNHATSKTLEVVNNGAGTANLDVPNGSISCGVNIFNTGSIVSGTHLSAGGGGVYCNDGDDFQWSDPQTRIFLGSIYAAIPTNGSAEYVNVGNPSPRGRSVDTNPVRFAAILNPYLGADPVTSVVKITNLEVYGYRSGGSATTDMALKSADWDMTSGVTTHGSYSIAGTGWVSRDLRLDWGGSDITVAADQVYYIEWICTPDTANTDSEAGGFKLTITRELLR